MELAKVKRAYCILASALTVTGLILIIKPQSAINLMFKITGIVCILFGIVKLMGYFSKDIFQLAFQFDLTLGIISCVIGLAALFKTKLSVEVLGALLGAFILMDALSKVQTAIDAKKFGLSRWYLLMTAAATASVIGILFLLLPFKSTTLVVRLIGINLTIDGILNLIIVKTTVRNTRRKKEWEI